ncbi:helix-turn-helix transcriptional regulator [Kordia sp. SMS9]|uniref:helix-turn-helix transcriptional regulator n=1 Tax=Kordia sp. SMS9 TaxID=2282170 RepID=UPI0013B3EE10|nr:helix-turn-helix transcriptional regulator [Kordia sp. SMS9]
MKNRVPFSLFILYCAVPFAQENFEFTIPDSLASKSYKELRAAFNTDRKDSTRRLIYAKTYIAKATKTNERLEMVKGYELLGFANDHNFRKSFIYYDKGAEISKDLKNVQYPAIFYTYKGAILSEKGSYKEALENHLKAIEYAEVNNNEELIYVNKHNIGILKRHLELYEEALLLFKECYVYELKSSERDEHDFLRTHLALADIYTETRVLDSAKKYNTAGYNLARRLNKGYVKSFKVYAGIISFHEEKYQKAIVSIKNAIDSLDQDIQKYTVMNGFFYSAKAYEVLQQEKKAISYYKKVDSVFTKYPYNFSSNLMESYDALYKYYKKVNDKTNAVKYIEKALYAYNIHKEDYLTLSDKIKKTFDRRELLEKQKALNKALNQKDKKHATFKIIALIVGIIFIFVLTAFYIKQRQIKKRFQEFVKNHEKAQKSPKKPVKIDEAEVQKIGLADDIIEQILSSLYTFETKHAYIKSDITLTSLSKQFKTNSAYLSKVINTYKNKKFAAYLNDLRIDYAIHKIQSDTHFRLYTFQAIALEVGFNNSQSFTRAFKRKTGIKPSDFMRQLERS